MDSLLNVKSSTEQLSASTSNFTLRFFENCKWQILVFFVIFTLIGTPKLFFPGFIHPSASMETVTMVGAAFAAGLDWSAVISGYLYTGFGFTLLLFPVFMFNLSPHSILVVIGLANTVLLSFCGVIAYNIMTRIFEIKCKKIAVITSIATACLYMNIFISNLISNHIMMVFLDWSILFILLVMAKRAEFDKSNIIQSLLLSFLMCYGFLVHTRIFFLWGAIIVFLLCCLIVKRKVIVSLWVFLPSFVVLFFLASILVGYVQSTVYLVGHNEGLQNDVAWIGRVLTHFGYELSWYTIVLAFLRMIVAQLNNIFTLSSGLALIPIVALATIFICLLWKRTRAQTQLVIKENTLLFLATMYTVAHVVAILLLMAWGYVPGVQATRPDAIAFIMNYWAVALSPTIALSISIFYKIKTTIASKLILTTTTVAIIAVSVLFAYLVAPFIHADAWMRDGPEWTVYAPLTFWSWIFGERFEPGSTHFLTMTIVATAITLVLFLLVHKRKLHLASALLLTFFLYSFNYTTINYHMPMSQGMAAEYRHVYGLFKEADITEEERPYVYARGGRRSLSNLQFNLYRHSIVPITHELGYPRFIDIDEIPIYVTNNVGVALGSWNMFWGGDHKLVDFGEDLVGHQVLINTADTALVAKIESARYELVALDTLHFDVSSLRFHRVNTVDGPAFFLAPSNFSLGVRLPAGTYEFTLRGDDMSIELEDVLPSLPESMAITNNELRYFFTLDHSRTLAEFFRTDAGWELVEYLVGNNIWYIDQLEDIELRITERFPLRQLSAYELGAPIYFDDDDNANYHGHILSGMPLQEEFGAWTQGHMAEFVFFLNDAQGAEQRIYDDLLFSFTAEPLVTPSYLAPEPGQPRLIAQRVEIEVNGEVLDVMNIIRHGTYEVRIPAELIADGNRLHILLRLPTATSPAALGIDMDDDRVLALFLEEMRILTVS